MALNRNDISRDEPVFWKKDCSPFDIGVLFNEINSFFGRIQGSLKSSRECGVHGAIFLYILEQLRERASKV